MFSPTLIPLWDAGGPLLLVFLGVALLAVIIGSIVIILIEAFILWRWFDYGSFGSSIVVSLVMNVASTIVGVILASIGGTALGFILLFLVSWVVTIAVEAGVIKLMKRQATKAQIWRMSLTVNTVSYLLLIAVGLLFSGLTSIS